MSQSGPGSNGNEEVLHIPPNTKIGASPSDDLVSYLFVGRSNPLQIFSQRVIQSESTGQT